MLVWFNGLNIYKTVWKLLFMRARLLAAARVGKKVERNGKTA